MTSENPPMRSLVEAALTEAQKISPRLRWSVQAVDRETGEIGTAHDLEARELRAVAAIVLLGANGGGGEASAPPANASAPARPESQPTGGTAYASPPAEGPPSTEDALMVVTRSIPFGSFDARAVEPEEPARYDVDAAWSRVLIERAKEGEERAEVGKPGVEQQSSHAVLPASARAADHRVRPLRTKYKHLKCGVVTTMGLSIAETYAVKPDAYGSTYCVGCRGYFPVGADGEFIWDDAEGAKVGT